MNLFALHSLSHSVTESASQGFNDFFIRSIQYSLNNLLQFLTKESSSDIKELLLNCSPLYILHAVIHSLSLFVRSPCCQSPRSYGQFALVLCRNQCLANNFSCGQLYFELDKEMPNV